MSEVLVGKVGDFAVDDYRVVVVADLEVGIFNRGDRIVAYENRCPHMGGPVCQGKMINRVEEVLSPEKKSLGQRFARDRHIICPWHGYEFNLDTGCHPGKSSVRLRPVDIEVRDGNVFVSLPRRK